MTNTHRWDVCGFCTVFPQNSHKTKYVASLFSTGHLHNILLKHSHPQMYLCVRHCESTLLSSKHLISLLQVVHLLSQVEAEKLEVVRRDEEMTLASQRSMRDQEALLEAQAQVESLDARLLETQEQLEREVERRKALEEEKERLEERLNRAGQREESGAPHADSHSVRITGSIQEYVHLVS